MKEYTQRKHDGTLCQGRSCSRKRGQKDKTTTKIISLIISLTLREEEEGKEKEGVTGSEDDDGTANEVFWPKEGEVCSKWWTDGARGK